MRSKPRLGAWPVEGGVSFRVWAPEKGRVAVVREPSGERALELTKQPDGSFTGESAELRPGDLYRYLIDGTQRVPDPASRFQPHGAHGPSEIIDPAAYRWQHEPSAAPDLRELVIYELHVGTFTAEGTFRAATERLRDLAELGVNAIELMPVAEFAGDRGWGYDSVDLFAPHHAYGRPEDLKRLVDVAHSLGISVLLDVVYNHFGPSGNYLPQVTGAYLSERHRSSWGPSLNFDGPSADGVRELVIENALQWICDYRFDGLRLDATHAIVDDSKEHVLAELARLVREGAGRPIIIIAEDDRNQRAVVTKDEEGSLGLDAVWADDFHHQVRRHVAGDSEGYFADYSGSTVDLVRTINEGWFYTGQRSVRSGKPRGSRTNGIPRERFFICIQNHDQVGNRAMGDRLTSSIDLPTYRAASTLLLMSPETPLIFMGQEWAASTPFLFFTDHDEELGQLIRAGRRSEFAAFSAFGDADKREMIPDPQATETFVRSRLIWEERAASPHAQVLELYRALIALRREVAALGREDAHALPLSDEALALVYGTPTSSDGAVAVIRLTGSGELSLPPPIVEMLTGHGVRVETALSTEDSRFSADPVPARLSLEGAAPRLHFHRPGAVVLRWFRGER